MGVDALADLYIGINGYAYCHNSPIIMIDPDGNSDYPIYGTDGKYLGDDGRSGGGDLAFTGEKDGKGGFRNLEQFTNNHTDFNRAGGRLRKESSGNKIESLWIAHTANNASKFRDTRFGKGVLGQLNSKEYSTTGDAVPPLSILDNTEKTIFARAGLIDVLSGGADPTNGSVLWDGADLLQKGLTQNKFKEYGTVTIAEADFDTFAKNQLIFTGTKPNEVFSKTNLLNVPEHTGWSGNKFFSNGWSKGPNYYNLQSNDAQGATIFWKVTKM
jgi:hypothetical protein